MSGAISSSLRSKTALIYDGEGANKESSLALKQALSKYFGKVECVRADYLKTASWEDHTSLLVIGGGRVSLIIAALGDIGQKKIEDYVKIFGGNLFGVCAGFYYLPKFSFYHYKDDHQDKKRDYPLIDGYARGPLTSPDVAEIVQIYTPAGTRKSGGCYAQGNPAYYPGSSTSILATIGTYTDDSPKPSDPIAIGVFQSGNGVVAGSAVHLEFTPPRTRSPFESPEMSSLYDRMSEEEYFRISTLEDLLKEIFPGALIESVSAEYDDSDLSPSRFADKESENLGSPAILAMTASTTLSMTSSLTLSMTSSTTLSMPPARTRSQSSCPDLEGLDEYFCNYYTGE